MRLVSLLLAIVLMWACEPPVARGEPETPEDEWSARPAPESMRHSGDGLVAAAVCISDQVQADSSRISVIITDVTRWATEVLPLLAQFEFTPWDEIPYGARDEVEKSWSRESALARARRAIELGVPVSSIVCKPEYPNCRSFDPGSDAVGPNYVIVLTGAVNDIVDATRRLGEERDAALAGVRVALGSGEISLAASASARLIAPQRELLSTFLRFQELLPKSAVLPSFEFPDRVRIPTCDD